MSSVGKEETCPLSTASQERAMLVKEGDVSWDNNFVLSIENWTKLIVGKMPKLMRSQQK